jgi:polyferredoxin
MLPMILFVAKKEVGRAKFNKQEDRAVTGKGIVLIVNNVLMCPTGIDIRNGTQMECVNCTACIDECDTIMESVGLPKGLIRYASEDEIEKKSSNCKNEGTPLFWPFWSEY